MQGAQHKASPFIAMQGTMADKGINYTTSVLTILLGLTGISTDMAFPNNSDDTSVKFEFFAIASSYIAMVGLSQLTDNITRNFLIKDGDVVPSTDASQINKARITQVISAAIALAYAALLAAANYCHDPDDITDGELMFSSCSGDRRGASSPNITIVLSFYVFLSFVANLFEAYSPFLLVPSHHEGSRVELAYSAFAMVLRPLAAIVFTNSYSEPDFAKFSVELVRADEDSQSTVDEYSSQMETLFLLFNATDQFNNASDGICNFVRNKTDSDIVAISTLFTVKAGVFIMGLMLLVLSVEAHNFRNNDMGGSVDEPYGTTAPSFLGMFGCIVMANALPKIIYSALYYMKAAPTEAPISEQEMATRSVVSGGGVEEQGPASMSHTAMFQGAIESHHSSTVEQTL